MSGLERLTLVSNPYAGKGKGGRVLPEVVRRLTQHLPGTQLDIHETRTFAHARRSIRYAVERAAEAPEREALMVLGGDGMMTLGVDACAGTDVPLGMIPAGTGNDMSRGFGLHGVDPLFALRRVIAGYTRHIDALRVRGDLDDGETERHVGTIVATGFDANVNRRANAMTLPIGNLRYLASVGTEIRHFRPMEYRLTIDGQVREMDAILVSVGNTKYFGGGIKICPDADPTDGRLDVTIVHPVPRAVLVAMFPSILPGWFVNLPVVETFRARSVRVEGPEVIAMGDGELLGSEPIDIDVRPRALRIFG